MKQTEIGNAALVAEQSEASSVPSVVFIATGGGPQVNSVVRYLDEMLGGTSADLTHCNESAAIPALRRSNAVFLISSTDPIALELARERAEWLSVQGLKERCGVILWRSDAGISAAEAENIVGLPVCGLLNGEQETYALAQWLAAEQASAQQDMQEIRA